LAGALNRFAGNEKLQLQHILEELKMKSLLFALVFILAFRASTAYCTIEVPFTTAPYDAYVSGTPSWGSNHFPDIGNLCHGGECDLILGTPAGATLTLCFENPFADGPGDDFAIKTVPASISWGHLADEAEFSFYMDDMFVDSFIGNIDKPDSLFTYELPDEDIVANRIVIKNLATYQGSWDDTEIVYADAGVAYTIPEPGTVLLFGVGGMALLRRRRDK
jgi:hypothetical protein